jgi:acyl-CoA thioester hydrolase
MKKSEVELRVRYGETDRMGYCYYGNYAQYLEVGRVEALRELGVSYKELEDQGIGLPVQNYQITYKRPAHYDDKLKVVTIIRSCKGAKIVFDYEIRKEDGVVVCEAQTTLVFVDMETGRPMKAPARIVELIGRA